MDEARADLGADLRIASSSTQTVSSKQLLTLLYITAMSTLMTTRPSTTSRSRDDNRPAKRKKEARTDIWSSLLRQTREAQARSRTQTLQQRDLVVCGGSSGDQIAFIQTLARPPPPQPLGRNQNAAQSRQRGRGEVKLANRFAYGYGHVTLFSPPQQSASGMGMLVGEAEEVARVECHCFPGEGVGGFEGTLRRLMVGKGGAEVDEDSEKDVKKEYQRRPSVALLLSWKEPWLFLEQLRKWLQLLARSMVPAEQVRRVEDPVDMLKEAGLHLTVVVQHVEVQEGLERENYKEETFDYISQHLRTCILPLSAGLVYTSSSSPPQQPGAPLNEVQKVLFSSLDLDLGVLSPKNAGRPGSSAGSTLKRDELAPRHNVVDRMAIVVPSGWDSVGKIRLLSETFSPEAVMEGWRSDLNVPLFVHPAPPTEQNEEEDKSQGESRDHGQANGGAEVFESASPAPTSPIAPSPPMSPSKQPRSAITPYEESIQDPNAHKRPSSPKIEVTTKPEQQFLAEMRTQLQKFEQQDADRQRREPGLVSTTAGSLRTSGTGGEKERREGQSGALEDLGDVAFNVGGVSYNAVSAEAAIERLKRPQQHRETGSSSPRAESPSVSTPRQVTPRPPKREQREQRETSASAGGEGVGTPQTGSGKGDMNIDQLEQYFASLMKRGGGGGGSTQGTPSRGPSGA